jgi:prephenate dehydrogenase
VTEDESGDTSPRSKMKQRDTVAILGVGLLGGSIGLALRQRGLAQTVVGIGRTASRLRIAEEIGAVSWSTSDIHRGVAEADLIVICTPVGHVVEHVRQVRSACRPDALVTDVGSTKGEICRALAAATDGPGAFVGSHPLAGSEKSGPEFADPNLFEGCVTVVTPTDAAAETRVSEVEEFWRSLGSRVLRMAPDEHDRAVAEISHLPHLVASALAASTEPRDLVLAATGWRDTTRVASGDVELWQQIFAENRSHVLRSLAKFEKVLSAFRQALEADDSAELVRLLAAGKRQRDRLAN